LFLYPPGENRVRWAHVGRATHRVAGRDGDRRPRGEGGSPTLGLVHIRSPAQSSRPDSPLTGDSHKSTARNAVIHVVDSNYGKVSLIDADYFGVTLTHVFV